MRRADARRFVRAAGVLAVAVSLSADQTPSSQSDAELAALLADAQRTFTDHDWDRGAVAYEALLTAARAKGSELWEARAILGFGRIASERSQLAEARVRALEALEIFDRLQASNDSGLANRTLGAVAEAANDDATAKQYYERAAAHFRDGGDTAARVEARYRQLTVSGPDRPLEEYAALQREAHDLRDKALEGHILHTWGDMLFAQALYEPAIEKLEAAAALFQEDQRTDELGTTYNSLGRVYREHGQPAAALQFQLKALAIHETRNTPRLLIQSLNAVAVASEVSGDKDQARVYYERALAAAQQAGNPAYITFMRANVGGFLIESDVDVERGRDLVERALADGAVFRSLRYTQLAMAFQKARRYPDALAAAERALKECRAPTECLYARVEEGRTQAALGNDAAALAAQKEILAIIEKMHATLAASDLLKQDFQRLWEKVYSLTIDLHFKRGEHREALEAAELARSRAFLDLLASREARQAAAPQSDAAPPPVETQAAASPAAAPSALPLRGASGNPVPGSPTTTVTLRSEAAAPPPTLDGLTAIATRLHSTLLAYWVGDNNLYAWVLTPDGNVRGASVSIARQKLNELIRSSAAFGRGDEGSSPARTTLATRGDAQIALSARNERTWRGLYDLLIAPIERDLPRTPGARLTIVPYGPLLDVPFAALRDARGRYLIERYTIHSVPAAAVLQFTAAKVRADARAGDVLLIGDPAAPPRIPGEAPLPRLAGANEEVRAIARLVPAVRTTVLSGPAATEPRVRTALPGKAVIHFATHGIVRDGNPLASFLALGTVGEGVADGQLTADKIYGLDLAANLIVLSACRSGGGVITGDGIAGLARAFFYAGTPSVIVSVWDVADQPTNQLLPAFYRAWLNGADKASALRTAQLGLIRSLRAGQVKVTLPAGTFVLPEDPAFWAAFVLLGEPD
jgi:CHAT domain-containing protein